MFRVTETHMQKPFWMRVRGPNRMSALGVKRASGGDSPPARPASWPAPPDPGLRDLRSLRQGALYGALGYATLIAAYAAFAVQRATGVLRELGVFLSLVWTANLIAGAVFASVALAIGVAAGVRRVPHRDAATLALALGDLAVAFAAPAALLVLAGRALSPYWWFYYLLFLPPALLAGAHIALLEPARTARGGGFRPILLLIPAAVGSLGPTVFLLTAYFTRPFDAVDALVLALSVLGFACDGVLVAAAGGEARRRTAAGSAWPGASA